MKSYIKSTLIAFAAVALLTACDENAWNDKLDGFEVPEVGADASTVTYTLTDADYSKIASYKLAGADEATADAVKAVGVNLAFPNNELAEQLITLFLADTKNNFYVYSDGSAIKVTYNVSTELPTNIADFRAKQPESYTVGPDDYMVAWGSEEDYINAYAPAAPATRYLPELLSEQYVDAVAGDYIVVSYNEAETNPIFGNVGGGEEGGGSAVELTNVLGECELGDEVTVTGMITAINKRGFVLTDNGGSILCYQASGFDPSAVAIGNYVTMTKEVGAYGTGLQLAIDGGDYTIEGTGSVQYPAPTVYTGAMIDEAVARVGNYRPVFVTFCGQAAVNGNYLNFNVDGATASQGSGYQVPAEIMSTITDGANYDVTGYFVSVSSGKFFNVCITSVTPASSAAPARAAAADVPSKPCNALYHFNGSKWEVANDFVILQPEDYAAMGQKYANLSDAAPEALLPIYCKQNYPYAVEGDMVNIVYAYYASSSTTYKVSCYIYEAGEWKLNPFSEPSTSQFVKNKGVWAFNPSVVVTLPYSRNTEPSYSYYMACAEWVFENISKSMGDYSSMTADKTNPTPFIDYRGNAEFYSGASAYYGNVDIRASTALNNAPEGYTAYEGLTDEEITLLMKRRFCHETMRGGLALLFPDAKPIEGMDVTYTIHFTAYEQGGVNNEYTLVYKVAGPAEFEFVSCTWFATPEEAQKP
ncbi:MAG: hypothetical protein J6R27_01840 [Muribaculaceae bacterium]|nr:hypothetical protein [Muribaculaceae bacterium]